MEVIVMKVMRKEGSSVVTGVIGASVGPFAGDGLDEAFGLAIGLRAIGSGEAVLEAELLTSGGEEFGAVSGTAIGEQALDFDAMALIEGDGLPESIQGAGDFLVRMKRGKGETAVIVDGNVEAFDAGAGIALGAVAGGADAWALEAAQLLDVEVEEVAGSIAFVADDRGLGRLQSSEALQAMTAQDAGEGGLGDGEHHLDLSVGTALAAQLQDLGLELRRGLERLMPRSRRVVVEAGWEALRFGASQPAADGLFADAEGKGGGAQREPELLMPESHLRSCERSQFGISVHDLRAGWRWVGCASTTSLPDPFRADNLLKHDT